MQRAGSLIRQQLAADTNAQTLRVRQEEISRKVAHLQEDFAKAREQVVRDCEGRIADEVCSMVGSYLRARRQAYVSQVLAGQDPGPLLTADAGNSFQLAVNQCLTPVLQEAARRLQAAVSVGAVDSSGVGGSANVGAAEGGGSGGAVVGAAAGAGAGFMVAGPVGALVGGVVMGLVGLFASKSGQESQANEKVASALEQLVQRIRAATPGQLRQVVDRFLADLQQQIDARLQSESQKLEQIAEQLQADAKTRDEVAEKAKTALARVSVLLAGDGRAVVG